MIIWIASYPCSGNSFFRILLHQFSGFSTYTNYDKKTSISQNLRSIVGYQPLPMSQEKMQNASELFFIKTHELPSDQSPAIYLVRDGRDALVSYAHYIFANYPEQICDRTFDQVLRDLVISSNHVSGWSGHVLTWTQRQAPTIILRFEYLIQHPHPQDIIHYALQRLNINQDIISQDAKIPEFKDSKKEYLSYFRNGQVGQWLTEMPMDIQAEFWKKHGYAMQKMGYSQHRSFLSMGVEFFEAENFVSQKNEYFILPTKAINKLKTELIEKEKTIQNMAFFLKLSPSYWLVIHFRPFLKRKLPKRLVTFIRRNKNPLSLELQFTPRSIRLPRSYYCVNKSISSDEMPWISVVTPSYNQVQYISKTIESILQQKYPNLDYVIQDGGSNDGTTEILARYAQQVSHIESSPDGGQAHAINLGFQKTKGEIMAWLNADDILLPGALHYVSEFFSNNPGVDVVYSHRILINEQGHEFSRWILPPHDHEILSWADYIPQETLFWRREIWNKVGGKVDQSYRFAMDWDLLLRFRAAGAKFVRLPRFLGAFRVHSQQKTQALYDVGEEEMNRLRWTQHGETVSIFNVNQKVNQYLRRANWYRFLYQMKLLRY
ncbi:glycosyltransferase [Spirulina major]|uniref:glycosyltransferase n=1 Tax=Spirulina major TaxID=270636 RepID=UPI000A002F15|nr:glycosyltransferase [Spirulina major]